MNKFLSLLVLLFSLTSCATKPPQAPDAAADTKLGLVAEESAGNAESSLSELQEMQRREQKQRLDRIVTEPVADTRQTN